MRRAQGSQASGQVDAATLLLVPPLEFDELASFDFAADPEPPDPDSDELADDEDEEEGELDSLALDSFEPEAAPSDDFPFARLSVR